MGCGDDADAADVLERYGYYRLSGYWHLYCDRPAPHRHPWALGATRQEDPSALPVPTTAYRDWLEKYDRHEKRARGDFVAHFRQQYGPHLPNWLATEVMSFGVLSSLYDLMQQSDQEILAARFQVHTADGHGDRGALGDWLNNLRNVRNICAHYGRLWNRAFDVLIDAPGQARRDADDLLAPLVEGGTNNRLYGVLLIMRHLLLSIAPVRMDLVDLADFIEEQSRKIGFGMEQLGFPDHWRGSPIWDRGFALDRSSAVEGLDRVEVRFMARHDRRRLHDRHLVLPALRSGFVLPTAGVILEFDDPGSAVSVRWLRKLKDRRAAARVLVRIDRLAAGNPGDVRPVGSGISELRIDYGPGYRVYYLQEGQRLIVLLCGGDKSSQDRDIEQAHRCAEEWKNDDQDD